MLEKGEQNIIDQEEHDVIEKGEQNVLEKRESRMC